MICQNCNALLPMSKTRCPSCHHLNPYNTKGHGTAKEVQMALKKMIEEQHDNITDQDRFISIMLDYLPGYEAEGLLLKKAVKARFFEEVLGTENKKIAYSNIRSRFMHTAGFNREEVEFVLACFGYMLGLPYVSTLFVDDNPIPPEPEESEVKEEPIVIKPKVFGKFDAFKYKLFSTIEVKNIYTELAPYCFDNFGRVKEMSLPDTLTTIGEYAFSDCKSLETLVIPKSVKKIGKGAFNACVGLKKIKLPPDILSIGDNCFFCCTSLKNLRIPDEVSSIGEHAFGGCTSLEKIVIPKNVKFVNDGAFEYCSKVTVICTENTFIHRYCMQNKIKFTAIPLGEDLPDDSYLHMI